MHYGNKREAAVTCRSSTFSFWGRYLLWSLKIELPFFRYALIMRLTSFSSVNTLLGLFVCQGLIPLRWQYITPKFPFWREQHLLFTTVEVANSRVFEKKWVKNKKSDQDWKSWGLQKGSAGLPNLWAMCTQHSAVWPCPVPPYSTETLPHLPGCAPIAQQQPNISVRSAWFSFDLGLDANWLERTLVLFGNSPQSCKRYLGLEDKVIPADDQPWAASVLSSQESYSIQNVTFESWNYGEHWYSSVFKKMICTWLFFNSVWLV